MDGDEAEVELDTRPLGVIALALSLFAALLAYSYLYSPLAYGVVLLSLPLGLVCRREPATARLGRLAVAISGAAVVLATYMLVVWA